MKQTPLQQHLIATIQENQGAITFHDFMEIALYHPTYGYYSNAQNIFGKHGDFMTAPEISPLFAACLARQCQQVLNTDNTANILEFGAGSGKLAVTLCQSLISLNCMPKHYYIVEISEQLRSQQQQLLQQELPAYYDRFVWLQDLSHFTFTGVVLANEVLDAMPVHRFQLHDACAYELYVSYSPQQQQFYWCQQAPSNDTVADAIASIRAQLPTAIDYQSEINLHIKPWLQSIRSILTRGIVLIIDYGYPAHEYYHPQRNRGTLTCYSQHQYHDNPFYNPGAEDISAHVDFSALALTAHALGFTIAGFTQQAAFLLGCGLNTLVENQSDQSALSQAKTAEQCKLLLMPQEMGEIVKVLALAYDFTQPLIGFGLQDHRDRLLWYDNASSIGS